MKELDERFFNSKHWFMVVRKCPNTFGQIMLRQPLRPLAQFPIRKNCSAHAGIRFPRTAPLNSNNNRRTQHKMVAQALSLLLQRTSIDDHGEVLTSANDVLAKCKSDLHAQHVKVVALSKLDRYEDSLRVFEEAGDGLKKRAPLEYAYALYKGGKVEEAIDVITRLGGGRGANHLEAQASYRAEKFRRAADLYQDLLQDKEALANEENDLRINSWAVDAQLQWKGYPDSVRHGRPSRDDLEAFETVYNAACLSIAKGEFDQSEMLLKRAKELCRTSEDLTPEDKVEELLPISVQQLYVLIRQGKSAEAESVMEEISVDGITERSTKNIAQNNITVTRGTPENPFLLHKALHQTPDTTDADKLFDYQNNILMNNSHSVDLLAQKYDGIIRSASKTLSHSSYPSIESRTNLLSVYSAAAHARGQTDSKALKQIIPLLERRPKDVGLVLTAVQHYVNAGNTTSAITTLEKSLQLLEESISEQDQDVRYAPGLLGVLISLYRREGRRIPIRTELAKAAAHWQARATEERPTTLLRAAGTSLLHSSDPSDLKTAGDLFKNLYQNDSTDRFAVAGYVASQAPLDYTKIESQVDTLPSVDDLISDIDTAALEQSGITPSSSSTAAAIAMAGARKRPSNGKTEKATKKRVRQSRLPKEYDANKAADPERWLPLKDRSSYRPKGRKNKQRAADRMQGGAVSERAEESPAGQPKVQTGGGGASSKKKKKGKR